MSTDEQDLSELLSWPEVMQGGLDGKFGPVWIRAAAIRQPDGVVWEGARHHEIIRRIVVLTKVKPVTGDQGFVSNNGEFLNRSEAAKLALENGQITIKRFNQRELFSEELWTAA